MRPERALEGQAAIKDLKGSAWSAMMGAYPSCGVFILNGGAAFILGARMGFILSLGLPSVFFLPTHPTIQDNTPSLVPGVSVSPPLT